MDLITDSKPWFHPKYTHQVFHRDETIKGMKDVSVSIYLSPTTLRPYVYWCCSDYGQQYDDITNILRLNFGEKSLLTNREDFINVLNHESRDTFKLHGKKITQFKKNVPLKQCGETLQPSILVKHLKERN